MLYALVVIYNKKCEESETLKTLIKHKKRMSIIIFDNSTKKEFNDNNSNYCNREKIDYYTLYKNVGLSKAYNYVIDRIKKTDNDYIIILDDDTFLNNEYIEEVCEEIKKGKKDVLLPIVKSNDQIISPSNVCFDCRVKSVKSIKEIDMNRITAINSGMVIKTSIYNKIKYNEEMFLDYVDHDFMKMVREGKKSIKVMNGKIRQCFSRNEIKPIKDELIRFKIYEKDFKNYCYKNNERFYYLISIFFYKIKECIKYKTLVFFRR